MKPFAAIGALFLLIALHHEQGLAQPPAAPPSPRTADAGERLVNCPRLMDVTTPAACDDANRRREILEIGTGRLTPPNPVFRDDPVIVYFVVTRRGIPSGMPAGTQVREYEGIRLSRYMSAVLVGDGFRIEPAPPSGGQIGGTPRDFGVGDRMVWRWNVTALDGPRHNLRIEVYYHMPMKNKDGGDEMTVTPVLAPDEPVEIPIRRTFAQWLDDVGEGIARGTSGVNLLTGFIVALGGLLTAWFSLPRLRRRWKARQAGPPPA